MPLARRKKAPRASSMSQPLLRAAALNRRAERAETWPLELVWARSRGSRSGMKGCRWEGKPTSSSDPDGTRETSWRIARSGS